MLLVDNLNGYKDMKTIPLVATFILLGFFASSSFAAGGQNQIQNPIFGDDCIETIPPGVDAAACEEMPAPAQSGVNVYFCDTTTIVICPDDDSEQD